MRTKNQYSLKQNVIPDGEGFTALPIVFFITVIARAAARSNLCLNGNHLEQVDPARLEIAHLHYTKRSAVQVSSLTLFAPRNDES